MSIKNLIKFVFVCFWLIKVETYAKYIVGNKRFELDFKYFDREKRLKEQLGKRAEEGGEAVCWERAGGAEKRWSNRSRHGIM